MEIIDHSVMGIKEFEFLSGWLYGAGINYGAVCDIFTTEEQSVFNFTITFTEDDIKRDKLETFKRIFEND